MDSLNTQNQLEMARNAHDVSSLNGLRTAIANGDDADALKETAKQFESIFVQMMLKSMRKAQEALADENSPFNSQQVKFYRDMHDQQLAVDLSSNGGLGLAELIEKQLGQNTPGYTPASVIRSDGNLTSVNNRPRETLQQIQNAVLEPQTAGVKPAHKAPLYEDQQAFMQALYPHAERAAQALGTEPKAIIAQAAVESGWGQYVIHDGNGKPSYNLFGIKANSQWQGDQAVVDTLEFTGNVPARQKAAFRSYDDLGQAMDDYVDFIKSQPRYQDALKNSADTQAYFEGLQQAGYATDPAYANKVMSVYNGNTLDGFQP